MQTICRWKAMKNAHLFHLDGFSKIFTVLKHFSKYYTQFSRISLFSYWISDAIFKLLVGSMQMIRHWKAIENAHLFYLLQIFQILYGLRADSKINNKLLNPADNILPITFKGFIET